MRRLRMSRLTGMWLLASGLTLLASYFRTEPGGGNGISASLLATSGVFGAAWVKSRIVLRDFMEVRHAPTWLRAFTEAWALFLWLSLLAIDAWG